MSYNNSTSDSWFERYFEDRFAPIEATLSIWGVKMFPSKGYLARDEALQHVRIVLWNEYSNTPETWAVKPAQTWVAFAKQVYNHFILHEKVVERHTDYCEDLIPDDMDLTGEEALSGKLHTQQRSQYPREILLVDERMDLEQGIRRGFELLPQHLHADMRLVMIDIMEGYTQVEIRQRHDWSDNHIRMLYRRLRTTFYEALTGYKPALSGYVGSKAPATDEELVKLRELRAQGLSYMQIGARLGYSKAWVQKSLQRFQHHRPIDSEREKARSERIAEVQALLAQGKAYRTIALELGTSYNTVRQLLGKC